MLGLGISLWLLLFAGCTPYGSPPASPDQSQDDLPEQEGWNSTLSATRGSRLAAVIRYGHMRRFAGRQEIELDEGIEVDFFDERGEHTSHLVAEGGLLNEDTKNVEAIGRVVVVSDSGITLRTERLRWDRARDRIMTEEFVTITTADGDTLYGQGFESDVNLTEWETRKTSGVTKKRVALEPRRKRTWQTPADTLGRPAGGASAVGDSLVSGAQTKPDSTGRPGKTP